MRLLGVSSGNRYTAGGGQPHLDMPETKPSRFCVFYVAYLDQEGMYFADSLFYPGRRLIPTSRVANRA